MASNQRSRSKGSDGSMKGLITSIREQTSKLKVVATQSNLLLSKASKLLPPQGPSKHGKDTGAFSHSNPESSRLSPEVQDQAKGDYTYSKQLIENLLKDNKQFHEEIEDYRRKELELEKLKNSELDTLKQELQKANDKVQDVAKQNLVLKDKCLRLVEYLRQFAFETTEQEKEDQAAMERVARENAFLRDLLQVSRVSQPKVNEIEAALTLEEASLNAEAEAEYEKLIQGYREQRFSRKSKSIGNVAVKKNYLLDLSGVGASSQSQVWDSFFNKSGDSKLKAK